MKKLVFLLLIIACNQKGFCQNFAQAKLFFNNTEYDAGQVRQGEDIYYTFQFENKSADSVLLRTVYSTCGCTIVTWPREKIAPAAKGTIGVKFITSGRIGNQDKNIYLVYQGSQQKDKLKIKAEIILPKKTSGKI